MGAFIHHFWYAYLCVYLIERKADIILVILKKSNEAITPIRKTYTSKESGNPRLRYNGASKLKLSSQIKHGGTI